jgi:hypothetical protein
MSEEVARVIQSLGGVPRPCTNDGVVSLIEYVSCANDRNSWNTEMLPFVHPQYTTMGYLSFKS